MVKFSGVLGLILICLQHNATLIAHIHNLSERFSAT